LPDLLTHFAVAFALASPFLGTRRAFVIGVIALLPDLDVFFRVHRSVTHSAVVLLLFALPIAYLAHRGGVSWRALALAVASLLSHPILDMFQSYTPILYPFFGSVFVDVKAGFLFGGSLKPYFNLSVQTAAVDFTPFTSIKVPLLVLDTLPLSLVLIMISLLYSLTKMRSAVGAEVNPVVESRSPNPLEHDHTPISPNDVTVVIPTLNEREAIGLVLEELKREGYVNILVVDGYSTDGTPDIAREKGALVVNQYGAGKAGAIKTALELVKTPYMLVMDGDYTYDPRDIKRLLAHAPSYDEVIGARSNPQSMGWFHRLGNKIINQVFNLLLGAGLSDVCSGMYLIRTEALKGADLRSRGFDVEVEIAAHLCSYGKVTEVPINYRRRIGRRKLQTFRDGVQIVTSVISLARAYNPLFLFSTLASIFAIPGAILTIWELYLRYAYGAEAWSMGVAWLGLILLIIGLQGFTAATISLMLKRMERRIIQTLKGK